MPRAKQVQHPLLERVIPLAREAERLAEMMNRDRRLPRGRGAVGSSERSLLAVAVTTGTVATDPVRRVAVLMVRRSTPARGYPAAVEVCTIIAKNYVAHARVLARSLAEHNPGSRLWTLVIDDYSRYIDPASEPFEILTPADVGCEPFEYMALRYSVLELSTAVKPWLLRHLMAETGGPVTYLDPDIKVYGPLGELDHLAADHGVVVIPA